MQSIEVKRRISALKKAIKYTGGTHASLAEAIGVSRPLVSAWISGKKLISLKCAIKIEKVTHQQVKAESLVSPLESLKKYRENR